MSQKLITLSQAIEGYFIAAQARRLSPRTLADYNNAFGKLEAHLGDDPPLAHITRQDIRFFLSSLHRLSAKTVLNHHTALSALWTWAHREEIVDVHIIRQIDPPKPERPTIVPYTELDLRAMLAAANNTSTYHRRHTRHSSHSRPTAIRDKAIIMLLVDTGIRASELCDLKIKDLDIRNNQINVMGKGKKGRLLALDPRTVQSLWRYLATRHDADDPEAHVFTTRTRRRIDRHNLRHMLARIGRNAGVQRVTVHRFRHTFAINYLRNGGDIFSLKRMLGHSTLEMVNRYLAIGQADIRNAHRTASPVGNWRL